MLSVEISNKSIRVLAFAKKGRSIVIHKTALLSFSQDIFQSKDIKSLAKEFRTFLKTNRISENKVCFTLTHSGVVFKEMLLPPMSQKEAETVIVNDIERGSRFSARNYYYTYRGYQAIEVKRLRVIYSVVEKYLIDFCIRLLKDSGLKPRSFSLTPLNLVDIPFEKLPPKDIAYILLERQVSYVLFVNGHGCQGVYSMDWGLDDLGQSGSLDDEAFKNLSEELKRTIKSYETQHDNLICDILVVFDNEKYAGLEKRLALFVNRYAVAVSLPKTVALRSKTMPSLNFAYLPCLAAAEGYRSTKTHFDFSQIWDFRSTLDYRRKVLVGASIVALVTAFFGLASILKGYTGYQALLKQYRQAGDEVRVLEAQTATLDLERQKNADLRRKLLLQASAVSDLKKISWADTFMKIANATPKDSWVEAIALSRMGDIRLTGKALNLDAVALYIRNLRSVPGFRESILRSVREATIEKEIVQDFEINTGVIVAVDASDEKKDVK